MTFSLELKQKLHQQLLLVLNQKMKTILASIRDTSDSMKNDTKSSAGDKFETGREMMQMELNNKQSQVNKLKQLQIDLERVELNKTHHSVQFGSLIKSSMGNYFISVAMGKITHDNIQYYALSLASPIGQALRNKSAGDKVKFQGNTIEIKKII